jgi:flagellar biogenesis protein FliO
VAATAAEETPDAPAVTGAPDATAAHVGAAEDPWAVVKPEIPAEESRPVKRRSQGGTTALLAGKADGAGRSWTRTVGALAGVVALIVFLAWGYRALAGGALPLSTRPRRQGVIEIVSRAPLSARQSVCLVRVGPRLVLVGQSQDSLRALDVIDDADLVAQLAGRAAQKRADSSNAEFHGCLEREARAYQDPADAVDETIAPDAARIASVQEGLAQTIRRIRRTVTAG